MKARNKIHKKVECIHKILQMLKSWVQGDYSELVAEMGEDVLPVEYGGNNGTCQDIQGNIYMDQLALA